MRQETFAILFLMRWHPLMACALFIVPGVPLINFVCDMLDGYIEVGMGGKLSLDGGELHVDGRIDSLLYEDADRPSGGLLSRLFGG